jgi:hypothetical protein
MRTKIRIDSESGLAYIAKALRAEGFVGEVVGLANARTLTLIMPGTKLADVKRSLETIINDLDLRIEYEDKRKPEDESGATSLASPRVKA